MEKHKNIVEQEHTTTIVADEEGVVQHEETSHKLTTKQIEIEPDFVKLYLNDITRLYDLPRSTNKILLELLTFMQYDNIIALGKYRKTEIAKKLNITTGTLANALTKFIEQGILQKKSPSEFLVNPYIFGRGKWKDIKAIRLSISYDSKGKRMTVIRESE